MKGEFREGEHEMIGIKGLRRVSASFLFCAAMGVSTGASAQATRTWVSGVGDDANPCSRTAPCKTFAGAISKTAAGGEIDCLDPGGFGTVTITKSLTIDCDGTFGSILAAGTNGINVNDSATATPGTINVVIHGLSINGATTGLTGINFTSGRSLVVYDAIIQGFNSGTAVGVNFRPTATGGRLYLNDVTVINNGTTGNAGGGILIQPNGAGTATALLDDVRVNNNRGNGISIQGTSALMLTNSMVTGNAIFGINSSNGAPLGRVGNTTFSGNGTGVGVSQGGILSFGTNRVLGNTTEGAFSGTVQPES